MKELNTVQSLIITILIIIATSLISINSREVDSTIITIEKGMSLNSVSKLLLDENIIVDKNIFKIKQFREQIFARNFFNSFIF